MGKHNSLASSYHQSQENQLSCVQRELPELLQNNMLETFKYKITPPPQQTKYTKGKREV